ncbi:MAG: peptide chain release factor-like protein [Chloroflexi bacterium]|nr:peptide chain release factor-like protein [Chloroflexota bacterium]
MTQPRTADWRAYLDLADEALLAQCEVDRFRASGPGGQKRNKTDSAVRLRHRPSTLTGEANESRSQHENKARALRRLRLEIAFSLRAPVAIDACAPGVPVTGALKEALLSGKWAMSPRNPHFPAAVAALFDVLEVCGWRDAAAQLRMTTSALSRALSEEDIVFRAANERRTALALPTLHADR